MKRAMFYLFYSFLLFFETFLLAQPVEMTSPNGLYSLRLFEFNNQLVYSLNYDNQQVVLPSALGIKANAKVFTDLKISKVDKNVHKSSWSPVYGERSEIVDHYNSWTVKTTKSGFKDTILIDFRIYNEGVAFRYHFMGNNYLEITEELTEFTFPENTKAYYTPRAQTAYKLLALENWEGESERPLTLRLPQGQYACLTEAQVVDYVRTKFKLHDSKKNTIATSMYGQVDEIAPYSTPWRVIMCGNKAVDILQNNDLILNLNPPNEIKNTSWIKPGKVIREMTLSTQGAKELVDFAVKRNLQYIHFDAGWYGYEYTKESDATTVTLDPRRNPNPNALDLQEAIRYAKSKNIGVLLYVNQRALQSQLDTLLPLYKSWGVAGIKFGFVQVGSQVWTKWMHEAVKKCAQYELMVDIHDEYRPTGFSRTYPNLMTQEGIKGNEEFPDATHNATLPFTRFVAGAADYTICYYKQDFDKLAGKETSTPGRRLKTTPAHQLALSMIYYSPLQFLYWYDKPSDVQDEPELKFFDDLYTSWDDTKILDGEIGEFIAVARRKGWEWFACAITNNEARNLKIDLNFLPVNQKYIAEIYTDGDTSIKTRTKVKVSSFVVNAATKLDFALKMSGGVAVRLVPYTGKDSKLKHYKAKYRL